MRIALFGGSFNPVHIGHLKLARKVIEEYSLDKLILTPTYSTPLKDNSGFADSWHRLNMCRLAMRDYEKIEVSDIEIKRRGKSYTYLTLNSLKEIYPDDELFLVVGADMFETLDKWMCPEKIFRTASVIVVARDGVGIDLTQKAAELEKLGCVSYIISVPVFDISSTVIRNKISKHEDVSGYLTPLVLNYINENNLYR